MKNKSEPSYTNFSEEDAKVKPYSDKDTDNNADTWKILIADDDEEVHAMTSMVLKGFEFEGKEIELLHSFSEKQTIEIIDKETDIAVILLDVVMEHTNSGLVVVNYIRNKLNNYALRIVLRTAYPGEAPEEKVIINYDIDDYKEKTELTVRKLKTTIVTAIRTYNHIINKDKNILELEKSRERLKKLLGEKELLLREVHHRVKNNLQVISSLLNLQLNNIEDPYLQSVFMDSIHRIKAMSIIHEKLFQTKDLSSVKTTEYIMNIIKHLIRSYKIGDTYLELETEIEEIILSLDIAIPFGLIINEIVTNAIKHAFPETLEKPKLSLKINKSGEHITAVISDNGIGIDKPIDFNNINSVGLKLIYRLSQQINGSLVVQSSDEGGAEFIVKFKAFK